MNMFCLTPKVFDYLQTELDNFCLSKANLENKEFLMPEVIEKCAKKFSKFKTNHYRWKMDRNDC